MEADMTTLKRCLDYLDAHHVRYAHTVHSAAITAKQVAAAEYMPAHRMAKSVVICGEGFVFAVVPADTHVDLAQLRIAIGVSDLRVAAEAEIFLLFPNLELGAMPPLGPLFDMPVYLDGELARQLFITFNAGTHRDVIHMKTSDFTRLVQPVIGDFSRARIAESVSA
jgi:Ala-tRNA(Pro) deacylase